MQLAQNLLVVRTELKKEMHNSLENLNMVQQEIQWLDCPEPRLLDPEFRAEQRSEIAHSSAAASHSQLHLQ